ncbi:hypothetical protein BGP_4212 [Beggiatoa sp. PS]|nr:hypothetical protein BGP_4212 [Beggiatoa sp. PS]
MSISEIKQLALVQQKLIDSKKQLVDYHHRLKKKYGNSFKLTLISVVACGFERVVWEKVVIKEQS